MHAILIHGVLDLCIQCVRMAILLSDIFPYRIISDGAMDLILLQSNMCHGLVPHSFLTHCELLWIYLVEVLHEGDATLEVVGILVAFRGSTRCAVLQIALTTTIFVLVLQ